MGGCHCAICCGSLEGCLISETSRTKRRAAKGKAVQEPDDSDDYYAEYDPEIVSESDFEWMENLYVLGTNPEALGASKKVFSSSIS